MPAAKAAAESKVTRPPHMVNTTRDQVAMIGTAVMMMRMMMEAEVIAPIEFTAIEAFIVVVPALIRVGAAIGTGGKAKA